MDKRTWPAGALAAGGVGALLMAIWPGGMIEDGAQRVATNPEWWFAAHMIAGSLGVLGILIANQRVLLSRASAALGAVALLSVLVTEPFHPMVLVTTVLPALFLAAAAVALVPLVESTA